MAPRGRGGAPSAPPATENERRDSLNIQEVKRLDFDLVMADEAGFAAVLLFAKSEYADENLLFWSDWMKFKRELRDAAAAGDAPPVATGDGDEAAPPSSSKRDELLQEHGAHIIDSYLYDGAEMQVTLPDHGFHKSTAARDYEYTEGMFDKLAEITYKLIKQDTWMRFKLTDDCEALGRAQPHLTVDPAEEERQEVQSAARLVQRKLRDVLSQLGGRVGCERITAWLLEEQEAKLWSVCSTELGNSCISISLGKGLAGLAASSGEDIISNDAQSDERLESRVDKATAFVTRSVLCVVLKEGGATRAVIQLINKKSGDPAEGGLGADGAGGFDEGDAETVRSASGAEILETCSGLSLEGLLERRSSAVLAGTGPSTAE